MEQSSKPPEAPKPKSRTMFLAVIIVAILVVVGVGAYILLQKPPPTTAQVTITIWDQNGCSSAANCGFKDSSGSPNITISVGTTVQWKNTGSLPHTATSCDSSHPSSSGCALMDASTLPAFDTGDLSGGQTSSIVTFSTAGTYYYYCTVHPQFMHGKIVVQ